MRKEPIDSELDAMAASSSRTESVRGSKKGWSRTAVNFLLDAGLLCTLVVILTVTAIIRLVFPPASAAMNWKLWGWSLDQWINLQFAAIVVFALAILLHVMLHWNWVCGVVSSKLSEWRGRRIRIEEASRTLWGVALLIVIVNVIGIALAAAALSIHRLSSLP
jgi:hypothetical protein